MSLLDNCRRLDYDPDQPRAENGQWGEGGGTHGGGKGDHWPGDAPPTEKFGKRGKERVTKEYLNNHWKKSHDLGQTVRGLDSHAKEKLREVVQAAKSFKLGDPDAVGVQSSGCNSSDNRDWENLVDYGLVEFRIQDEGPGGRMRQFYYANSRGIAAVHELDRIHAEHVAAHGEDW